MTVTSGFFNSLDGDRRYDALDMSRMFDGVILDGVFQAYGDAFQVQANGENSVLVGTGRCWFNHTWTLNDATLPLELPSASLALARYDAIVVEINTTDAVRQNSIKVVQGTPASQPSYPEMIKTETVQQYPFAYVYRPKNDSDITPSQIISRIGTSDCPFVTGPLSIITIDQWTTAWESQWNQWFSGMTQEGNTEFDTWLNEKQIEFNIWFGNLQDMLEPDVAARLASAIAVLQDQYKTLANTQTIWLDVDDSDGSPITDSYDSVMSGRIVFQIAGQD